MEGEGSLTAELASRRSVTTRARLRALGFTDRRITGLVQRGRLRTVGKGVYADAGVADSFELRCAIASPPRTVVGAGGVLDDDDAESVIEQGLERRYFTVATIVRISQPLARTRAGRRVRRLLASRPEWLKPVRSDYELRLDRAMRTRGFPALVREHPVTDIDGDVVHPDLGVPADRFFVEVDYSTWHSGRRDAAYDRRRDMKLRLAGNHIERVSDVADEYLDETVEDLWVRWHQVRGAECTARVQNPPHKV